MIQVQTNDLRPDGFNVLHDPEMHRALAKNYGDCIKDTREIEAYWKAKFESWRFEIPDRIKQNLRTVKMIDRYWDEKRAAQKQAIEAEDRATKSMKKAR